MHSEASVKAQGLQLWQPVQNNFYQTVEVGQVIMYSQEFVYIMMKELMEKSILPAKRIASVLELNAN
jgi:hypothetical protein